MEQLLKNLNLQLPSKKEKVRLNVNVEEELERLMRLHIILQNGARAQSGGKIPDYLEGVLETLKAKICMMYMKLLQGIKTIPRLETLEKARVTEKSGPRLSRINQDLASRPYFKILNAQVLGRTSYSPLTKVAVHYNSNEMNSNYKSLEELRGFLKAVLPVVTHLDTTPKPELIEDWINSVALDSPTSHRSWLALDDNLGSKAERVKMNNLLLCLFEAEEKLAVLVDRFSDSEADHKKVLSLIDVSLFAAKRVRDQDLRKVIGRLQHQLCFLHGAHAVAYIVQSDDNSQFFALGEDFFTKEIF